MRKIKFKHKNTIVIEKNDLCKELKKIKSRDVFKPGGVPEKELPPIELPITENVIEDGSDI